MFGCAALRASSSLLLIISAFVVCVAGADTTPVIQKYLLKNDTEPSKYCLMMEAGIQLHFNLSVGNMTEMMTLDVPRGTNESANVQGKCSHTEQTLQLNFNDTTLEFMFNKTGKDAVLVAVRYNFSQSLFDGTPNISYSSVHRNMSEFRCPAGKGYLCMTNKTITFNQTVSPLVAIDTIKLRVEAFRTVNGTTFNDDYTQCEDDNRISNIVPIAVGAALGALVLVVLIAYLVGRKRNQRGYETV